MALIDADGSSEIRTREPPEGLPPFQDGALSLYATDPYPHQASTAKEKTGPEGIEPPLAVLETAVLPLHYGPSCAAWALIAAEQGSASASPDRSTIVAHTGGAVNPLTGFILATGYAEHLETLDGPRASHELSVHI